MIPPQSTKTRTPIQIGDIDVLNFCFCFMALSGFPLLAASCLAYLSFALRCWGVWAMFSWLGRLSHSTLQGPDDSGGILGEIICLVIITPLL